MSEDRAGASLRTPILGTAAAGLLLLALWQAGHAAYGTLVLPSPAETFWAMGKLATNGTLLPAVAQTAANALAGFAAAVLVGGMLGTFAGLWSPARHLLQPIATLALGVPAIAWVVLSLLWFGGSGLAVAFTVLVTTAPIVFAAATQGVLTLDGSLRRMARSFRVPWHVLMTDVYLPHMLTHLFPALATALAMSWKIAVMTELLGGTGGIGDGLATARVQVDTAAAMAWIVVIVVLLWMQDRLLLEPLRSRLEAWRRELPGAGASAFRSPAAT
ncbi:ABC transporter permease subunit [Xanthobacteraceae bacterium Astr-EGSB]|uniref:ABC transporter permease n=1 Tax=Astrobacterium formosum TaxID=3069710 RepID=UPI0027B30A68|nr:ABC transporter permease subunit [Xanthobacteraceae bacterium Astr-EGSB]